MSVIWVSPRHLVHPHRIDTTVVGLASTTVIVTGAYAATTLRDFAATLGLAVTIGLVYRIIGTWQELDTLSRALAVCLCLTVLGGAVAQMLLARASMPGGVGPPPNVLGNMLVISSRAAALVVVVWWNTLLTRR